MGINECFENEVCLAMNVKNSLPLSAPWPAFVIAKFEPFGKDLVHLRTAFAQGQYSMK